MLNAIARSIRGCDVCRRGLPLDLRCESALADNAQRYALHEHCGRTAALIGGSSLRTGLAVSAKNGGERRCFSTLEFLMSMRLSHLSRWRSQRSRSQRERSHIALWKRNIKLESPRSPRNPPAAVKSNARKLVEFLKHKTSFVGHGVSCRLGAGGGSSRGFWAWQAAWQKTRQAQTSKKHVGSGPRIYSQAAEASIVQTKELCKSQRPAATWPCQ